MAATVPASSSKCCSSTVDGLDSVASQESAAGHSKGQGLDPDKLCTALSIVMQSSKPNALHHATTFCSLSCVSKSLQQVLGQAAVGRLSASLLLVGGFPRSIYDTVDRGFVHGYQIMSPDANIPPATTEQLQWVLKRVKQQHMRQLTVWTECGWQHRQWFLDELMGSAPGLSSCGLLDTRAPAHAQAGFCHGVEIDFAPSCRSQGLLDSFCVAKVPITAQTVQPQLHMRFASALEAKLHSQERTAVLKHIKVLTCLQELQLPYFNPPASALAPVLSTLTALTKLFIRAPFPPEQEALPVTLQELTVGRYYEPIHTDWPIKGFPCPLHLAHLTALTSLEIDEQHRFEWSEGVQEFNWLPLVCVGVPAGSVLPASVEKLTVKGIKHVEPLLMLTQLRSLNISHMNSMSVTSDILLALSQLTSLTRVNITARLRTVVELQAYSPAFDALPVDLSRVRVEQSDGVSRSAGRTSSGRIEDGSCSTSAAMTDSNTSAMDAMRPASHWVFASMQIALDMMLGLRPLWRIP